MSLIDDIASQHLGKSTHYQSSYNPNLLVAIPRELNREGLGIKDHLPFIGYDVWHAYEVSFLTDKGLPVNGVLKIILPADSVTHVESKSLKLYLNSFNMMSLGLTSIEAIEKFLSHVRKDLSQLMEIPIQAYFYTQLSTQNVFRDYLPLSEIIDLENIEFKEASTKLSVVNGSKRLQFSTNLLRSNCRVTNQPDWGDVFIHYQSNKILDLASFAHFIVSMRSMNHFHEEICEYIYTELMSALEPDELMVCCLYTRRGGIDINPIRASHTHLIPNIFTDANTCQAKMMRQ